MSAQPTDVTAAKGFELAAGGLVWRYDDTGRTLAVVYRAEYKDWVLPKGRPTGNETPEATALREAMEETREKASLEKFAGSYSYYKDGHPKTVLIWHMIHEPAAYEHPAPKAEIEEVVWLSPEAAVTRLTHETEREFVARHGQDRLPQSKDDLVAAGPKQIRLRAAIHSVRWKFHAQTSRSKFNPDTWWVACARNALAMAETDLASGDLHGGWGALHDAERFMVFGMTDAELVGSAAKLKSETKQKLKGWRGAASDALLTPFNLTDWLKTGAALTDEDRTLLRQAIVEILGVMNESSDNLYHRMDLVEKQLSYLVKVCAILLILGFAGSITWAEPGSPLRIGYLAAVSLAGALGGVVSAMYQLSRVGDAKIPESLLHGLITTGRPLVGASSALFVYFVIQSNLISLVDASKVNLFTALVLGFVSGFSEQFVLKTVAKVAGTEQDEPDSGGKAGRKKKDPTDESDVDAIVSKARRHAQAGGKNTVPKSTAGEVPENTGVPGEGPASKP